MKKLTVITSSYYPVQGGLQSYIRNCIPYLVNEYEVDIITGSDYMDTGVAMNYIVDHIPVTRIKTFTFFGLVFPKSPYQYYRIWKLTREKDVVYSNDIKFIPFFLLFIKAFRGFRLILSSHGYFFHNKRNMWFKNLFMGLFSMLSGGYDYIFNISRQDFEIAKKYKLKHAIFLQEGVEFEAFNTIKKEVIPNQYLYFGRISKNKGLDLLLDNLVTLNHHFTMTFVGKSEGGYLEKLQHKATKLHLSDKINWAGPLPDNALFQEIKQAEIIFLPSTYEGFGITLIESLASGSKVIANKIPAYQEIAEQLKIEVVLHDFNQSETFEAKVEEIKASDKPLDTGLEFYSMKQMAEKLVNYIQSGHEG